MDKKKASRLLAQLAPLGVPPRDIATAGEILPMFSVGLDDWVDRISRTYLEDLSRADAHFKLVLAPYGGGKTHFLVTVGVRALTEGFAVSYVQCVPDRRGGPVRVDNPLGLYAEAVGRLQIKGQNGQGIPALLAAVVEAKRKAIEEGGAPDPDAAFGLYLRQLKQTFSSGVYGDFAQVAIEALRGYWDAGDLPPVTQAAEKWLEGRMDSLTREDFNLLGLRRVTAGQADAVGRKLMLALARFTRDAGCHGLVLLIDEVETLFTAKGKALHAVLGAMRVMLDWSGLATEEVPLFCAYAATPEVLGGITKYPALQQRLSVAGASFDEGNDFAPQINLERMPLGHEPLLETIGVRLVEVAQAACDGKLTSALQEDNARRLAAVASRHSLDVDARRLYVKTWAALLQLQISTGEREFQDEELARRYLGNFEKIQSEDEEGSEP